MTFTDARGRVVRTYASDDRAPAPIPDLDKPTYWERPFRTPSTSAGMPRFVWDLRAAAPRSVFEDLPISAVPGDTPRVPQGALVVPGRYTVTLDVDGKTSRHSFVVEMDPRVAIDAKALLDQYTISHDLAAMMDRTFDASAADRKAGAHAKADRLDALNGSLAQLLGVVDGADAPPTNQARQTYLKLRGEVSRALGERP